MPEVRHRTPEGTYLAWLDCRGLGVDDPAALFLREGGVAVSDGPPFGVGSEQHVRLNFATSTDLLEQIVAGHGPGRAHRAHPPLRHGPRATGQTAPMGATPPLRPVTDAEIETFRTDGVVCLRGVMPPDWLERMVDPGRGGHRR